MTKEKTVIAIKPDGIQRGLIGEIISRFERAGMKMVAAKLLCPTKVQVEKHYVYGDWLYNTGKKTIESYEKKGMKITGKPEEIGKKTLNKLINYLVDRPVFFMVWQGPGVVEIARKIIGHTSPQMADIGSVRGDYGLESYAMADGLDRALYNMIHASGTPEEAEHEMTVWFKPAELLNYDLFLEELVHNKNWGKIKK